MATEIHQNWCFSRKIWFFNNKSARDASVWLCIATQKVGKKQFEASFIGQILLKAGGLSKNLIVLSRDFVLIDKTELMVLLLVVLMWLVLFMFLDDV